MCIIIDTCVLSAVFKSNEKTHSNFKVVSNWILEGDGKLVYGGTKFTAEIIEHHLWFLKFLRLLKEVGKVVEVDKKKVDQRQKVIEGIESDPDFDDPHLIAIIGVTGCKLICTKDKRAIKFLTNPLLYPKNISPPSIFQNAKSHSQLLSANYIGKCCCPKRKLSKNQRTQIGLPTSER